ncbi:MAG: helix-turn-helix transcriptional regulator [Clostridia bacterium]|nr:helix-turn-helix transcriptional regulator [Clostridia bacterium]
MVNERISAAVADSGLKQKYIADRIGMSEPTFSAMLAGKRKVDVDEFFGLCQVLKKTPEELYHYKPAKEAV